MGIWWWKVKRKSPSIASARFLRFVEPFANTISHPAMSSYRRPLRTWKFFSTVKESCPMQTSRLCSPRSSNMFCRSNSPLPPGEGARSAGEGKNGLRSQRPSPGAHKTCAPPSPGGRGLTAILIILFLLFLTFASSALASSRIKDVAHFTGVRNNSLAGYGLVIGLKGTGDKQQTVFTQQSLKSMLDRFGVNLDNQTIRVQNIAAVMVTADLPAFERPGSKIDVTVSSIGDAASLQGGILLQTPLLGADGNVYAVAQGPLVLGGFSAGNDSTGVTVNHPTVGRISNGATVERAVVTGLPQTVETLDLELDSTDFTNVGRVTQALNDAFGRPIASALDGRSVRLSLPTDYRQRPVEFIAAVEAVSVDMDSKAKVVVNERTGTVIIGSDVTISPVSI